MWYTDFCFQLGLMIAAGQKSNDLSFGDTDFVPDTDASDLPGPHQLIGGVPADAEDGHEILYPESEGQLVEGAILSLQDDHPFSPTPGRCP